MSRSAPHLSLEAVAYRYGPHPVLDRVDFAVAAGERVGILGRSGVGKSTLLQLLAGLVAPASGVVRLGGVPVRGPVPGCTVMFQRPALLPWASVLDNVLLPARLSGRLGRDRAGCEGQARRLLDDLGLGERAEAKPHQLSGGQQQRVAIARALAPAPKVLLCDEPTSALDPELALEVVAVLRQLAQEGTTMLIATHDLRLAAQIAQQVIFLESGEVAEAGSARQMFTTPRRARTFEYISTLTERLPESWSI